MRLKSQHITFISLLLACVTTLLLLVQHESASNCTDAERRRLLSFALQHSQGTIQLTTCESSVFTLLYSIGAQTRQVLVVRESVAGIQVVYASEPHLHHVHPSVLHNR